MSTAHGQLYLKAGAVTNKPIIIGISKLSCYFDVQLFTDLI